MKIESGYIRNWNLSR